MARDDAVYLLHVIETARKAATHASGVVWKVATEDLCPLIVALEHLVAGESQA
jgi:hypothetical protein